MEERQSENLEIHKASKPDVARLKVMADTMGSAKQPGYFEQVIQRQEKGEREVFLAIYEGQDAGFCILNWDPKYALFRGLGIPEIQDLNVLPPFRSRGIATNMIIQCEDLARGKGYEKMGIAVGLSASYGSAQKLYIRLGYEPDGNGVTYDRTQVAEAEIRPVDDNLCLMMLKNLI